MDPVLLVEPQDVKVPKETPWNLKKNFGTPKKEEPQDVKLNMEDQHRSIDGKQKSSPLGPGVDLESELEQFVVYKTEKPFSCNICNYNGSNKRHLKQHIIKMHPIEEQFECYNCDYKCSVKKSLKHHIMTIHKEEAPFECGDCDKIFSRRENLELHLKIHSAE